MLMGLSSLGVDQGSLAEMDQLEPKTIQILFQCKYTSIHAQIAVVEDLQELETTKDHLVRS